ncbi:Tim17/Tim22/Tim23/Pmp24 family-domain-containing protein [Jimgerdemannia flammicorona]|uniref:Tim17/Tim22/Tim23/Pmp24 family-domain-containing protein n=1 Tax=Jimgerdemannia flammicorona TaxID=994334 RepID=A0A433QI71_9FUNG|nr:Tim17/Tim22/Tim23/Pmp24 family-domain-containing protein [Jimgerdemannia flammicorona]
MDALTNFVLDPNHREFLSLVKGARNGVVYGAKVRFPHALVMSFLFRDASLKEHVKFIYKATKQHAKNLGSFVFIYKTLMLLQKKANADKEANLHPFIAGVIGGYIVFGENNNINNQVGIRSGKGARRLRKWLGECLNAAIAVFLYIYFLLHVGLLHLSHFFFFFFDLFSPVYTLSLQMVLYLFSRIMVGLAKMPVKHKLIEAPPQTFSVFAAVVWGIVMWQFWHEREVLQPSLQGSMQYLYIDSNRWDSLKNFIWHNK